ELGAEDAGEVRDRFRSGALPRNGFPIRRQFARQEGFNTSPERLLLCRPPEFHECPYYGSLFIPLLMLWRPWLGLSTLRIVHIVRVETWCAKAPSERKARRRWDAPSRSCGRWRAASAAARTCRRSWASPRSAAPPPSVCCAISPKSGCSISMS